MKNFIELKKNLKINASGAKQINIAVLADSASQFIVDALRGYGLEYGVNYNVFEADYNQIDQLVFHPGSELYTSSFDFVIVLRSTQKLLSSFYKCSLADRETFASRQTDYLANLYQQIISRTKCSVIFNTYVETNDAVFGNFATKTKTSFVYQVKKLNCMLMELSQQSSAMFLSDLSALASYIGHNNSFDPKLYVNADMEYSLGFLPFLAKNIHDTIQAVTGVFKKCIIMDLDNTTWGGIIGDDGMEGIQIGSLGIGKAFTGLQTWVKELKSRGIIVAVCSKNTESIAMEPFLHHPDMVLRLDDIAVFVANWENKVDNIRHIQSILNIGFDSMVFLDDNPFEREMVSKAIPDLTVPSLPEDPVEYLPYLRSLNLFETASYTGNDEERTKQYQEESKRSALQKSFANEDEFLQSLGMQSVVKPFDSFTIPRIAQLSQRSNQFNLRTMRYTEEEVKEMATSADYYTLSYTLEDVYGEYGLIAYIILHKQNSTTLFIDSWVMSCRVLKRGMEIFTLKQIINFAQKQGFSKIIGEYIPTKKNEIVKDHYLNLGFTNAGDGKWELNMDSLPQFKDIFIKIKE
jgi:FkbH-like protein